MTKVTPAEKAILESVYQHYGWPIEKSTKQAVANQLRKPYKFVYRWFSRRHGDDELPQNLQQPALNVEPAPQQQQELPPPPVQPAQIEYGLVMQPQGQEEDDPMFGQEDNLMHQPQGQVFDYNDDNVMLDVDLLLGIPEALKIVRDTAIEELCTLFQGNEDLWAKDQITGKDVLVQAQYNALYPKPVNHSGSRDFCDCKMNQKDLANMLMKEVWCEVFPNMVAKEKTIEVFSPLKFEDPDGSCFLIYKEHQLTSTKVPPNRKVIVFRTCKRFDQGWVVAEVTHEPDQNESGYQSNCHRLPSGCLIEPLPNGLSRVTWVEHMEVAEIGPDPDDNRIEGGVPFGAAEMLSCLERYCERRTVEQATRVVKNPSFQDKEKLILMHLGHTMVKGLFDHIGPNEDENSSNFPSLDDYTTLYSVNDVGIGGAVMTFFVTQSPDSVLEILGNVQMRNEWDYLCGMRKLLPHVWYSTGEDPRNTVSLSKMDGEDMMLIQEVSVDKARSLVVWSTLLRETSYRISLGQETDVPLLVSGFVIRPNGHTTANNMGGSVVTFVLRLFVNVDGEPLDFIPSAVLEETVRRVKEALEKPRSLSPPTGT